ncbi:MAG: hypothetical protein M3Y81_04450 [Chloroflexota bacterium]|nr:hypothetical protein [Chloroflexota bacterium]
MSTPSNKYEEHVIASADSLLGQLQRGRGMGFLRALREGATVSGPLLFHCMTYDPRWDRQLESRSDYYAALLLQLALPLDPFDAYLRVCAETDSGDARDAESIVLDSICALAVRGDLSAIAIMRAYLAYGYEWEDVFETLMEVSNPRLSVDEVSRIIDQRFPDDDTLDDELPWVGPGMHTRKEPWRSLRQVNPRVDHILSRHEKEEEQRQHQQEMVQAELARLSTSELLALDVDSHMLQARLARLPTSELLALDVDLDADSHMAYLVARALQQHVTSADLDLLLQRAQDGARWQRFVAFRGLQRLAHPAALPVLQAFFESPAARPGSLYGAAVHAIAALPSSATLDLARDWFDAPDGSHRHVALLILKAHAMATDVGRVRAALLPSLERDTWGTSECYMQGVMLEILARFPEPESYTDAEIVFKEAKYARTRVYAAQVLAASNRDRFAHSIALECLWDCEERVRVIGCNSVDLHVPEAAPRLQAMAHDLHEDEEVRCAAKERLAVG